MSSSGRQNPEVVPVARPQHQPVRPECHGPAIAVGGRVLDGEQRQDLPPPTDGARSGLALDGSEVQWDARPTILPTCLAHGEDPAAAALTGRRLPLASRFDWRKRTMSHAALAPSHVAVVTGAASGIGLAAARRFAAMGLSVALADLPGERLDSRRARGGGGGRRREILTVPTDVSSRVEVAGLQAAVLERFGARSRADEQCRHPARQRHVRTRGRVGAGAGRQSLGRRSTACRSSCQA